MRFDIIKTLKYEYLANILKSRVMDVGFKILMVQSLVFTTVFLMFIKRGFFDFAKPLAIADTIIISALVACAYSLVIPFVWSKTRGLNPVFRFLIPLISCLTMTTFITAVSIVFSFLLGYCNNFWPPFIKYTLIYIKMHTLPMMVLGYVISAWKHSDEKLKSAVSTLLCVQVDNHTLYNGINYGVALACEGNAEATVELLGSMVDYFRKVTDYTSSGAIRLGDERQLMADYLHARCYSFKDDLKVEWLWDESLNGFTVPPMILQPLVENAVKHGVGLTRGGTLRIILERNSEGLRLATENAVAPETLKSKFLCKRKGVGIENLKSRLKLSFDRSASYRFRIQKGWAMAEIVISNRVLDFDNTLCKCKLFAMKALGG